MAGVKVRSVFTAKIASFGASRVRRPTFLSEMLWRKLSKCLLGSAVGRWRLEGESLAEAVPFRYRAFLSYCHRDMTWGKWLHGAIEGYCIDKDLVGRQTPAGRAG